MCRASKCPNSPATAASASSSRPPDSIWAAALMALAEGSVRLGVMIVPTDHPTQAPSKATTLGRSSAASPRDAEGSTRITTPRIPSARPRASRSLSQLRAEKPDLKHRDPHRNHCQDYGAYPGGNSLLRPEPASVIKEKHQRAQNAGRAPFPPAWGRRSP